MPVRLLASTEDGDIVHALTFVEHNRGRKSCSEGGNFFGIDEAGGASIWSCSVREPLIVETGLSDSWSADLIASGPRGGSETGIEEEEEEVCAVLVVEILARGLADAGDEIELLLECSVSSDRFSKDGKPTESGGVTLTTFMPWPVTPLAGMKTVVVPFLRLSVVLRG